MGTKRIRRSGKRRRTSRSHPNGWFFLLAVFIAAVIVIDVACRKHAVVSERPEGGDLKAPEISKEITPAAVNTSAADPVTEKKEEPEKPVMKSRNNPPAAQAEPVKTEPSQPQAIPAEWVEIKTEKKSDTGYIWWEGEAPSETNIDKWAIKNAGNLPPDQKEKLSGGNWIPMTGKQESPAYFAKYNIDVNTDGVYNFWVRKFWHHGPFKWRFDDKGEWRICDKSIGLADNVELRKYTCANWKALGPVELSKGKHSLHVEMLKNDGAGNIDCFLLIPGPFSPKGKNRPGSKYNRRKEGWFAFEPDMDSFSESPMDMSFLNEETAGSRGFLKTAGMNFEFENQPGKPVRFWSVNAGPNVIGLDKASLDYLARSLAKYGVNMVRYHGPVYDKDSADPTKMDEKLMDHLHYFQASLKKQGIYMYLSFYFPLWFHIKDSYGIPGYDKIDNKIPFSLLYFYPRMQEIYKSWARGLMKSTNPYTGIAFADDPAVGLVEVNNEDNYLFWTFNPDKNVPPECMKILEGRFYSWLVKKYGSIDKAQTAWGGNIEVKGDDFQNRRAGVYGAGMYTNQDWAKKARSPRTRDSLQFLTEDLRGFYEMIMKYYRNELGVKCPIIATNWTTAENKTLGALDKYTNMACDVMDRHGYFSGKRHSNAGWQQNRGDLYEDKSALFDPGSHCIKEVEYTGYPHTMSEVNWTYPNRYRAESMLLIPCYGALQGTDAFLNFALDAADWMVYHQRVCLVQEPMIMGQFPAASIIYRNGYVKEGPVVVHEALKLEDQYDFNGTATSGALNMDRLSEEEKKNLENGFGRLDKIDSYSYMVGQVTRTIGKDPGSSKIEDLSQYIDRSAKKVKSATGELLWDYGVGLIKVDAEKAQGAAGFFGNAGTVACNDLDIYFPVHYGTAVAVSLDGKPIGSSGKILVQIATESVNYNWKTTTVKKDGQDMKRIDEIGAPPIFIKEFSGSVRFKRADAASLKVTALDLNGYPKKTLNGFDGTLPLLPDVMYYIIEDSSQKSENR